MWIKGTAANGNLSERSYIPAVQSDNDLKHNLFRMCAVCAWGVCKAKNTGQDTHDAHALDRIIDVNWRLTVDLTVEACSKQSTYIYTTISEGRGHAIKDWIVLSTSSSLKYPGLGYGEMQVKALYGLGCIWCEYIGPMTSWNPEPPVASSSAYATPPPPPPPAPPAQGEL